MFIEFLLLNVKFLLKYGQFFIAGLCHHRFQNRTLQRLGDLNLISCLISVAVFPTGRRLFTAAAFWARLSCLGGFFGGLGRLGLLFRLGWFVIAWLVFARWAFIWTGLGFLAISRFNQFLSLHNFRFGVQCLLSCYYRCLFLLNLLLLFRRNRFTARRRFIFFFAGWTFNLFLFCRNRLLHLFLCFLLWWYSLRRVFWVIFVSTTRALIIWVNCRFFTSVRLRLRLLGRFGRGSFVDSHFFGLRLLDLGDRRRGGFGRSWGRAFLKGAGFALKINEPKVVMNVFFLYDDCQGLTIFVFAHSIYKIR